MRPRRSVDRVRGRRGVRAALRGVALVVGLGGVSAWSACDSGANNDPGLAAYLHVDNAQFVRGAMPDGTSSGPAVATFSLPTNTIWPGERATPLVGALAASATSAAIGLVGDVGYWIVPSGVPDVATPNLPSLRASLGFSSGIIAGEYALAVRAVDGTGRFGAASTQILTSTATAPTASSSSAADAPLAFTLAWDTESDLDLHVIDPLGSEIFRGAPSSYVVPRPGAPDPPDGGPGYGVLAFDSNAQCVIDGHREEEVAWRGPPPSGHYLVRVDTASLCGQPIAHWSTEVLAHGSVLARAAGTSLDSDTWGPHDRGAGQLALDVVVP